MYHNKQHIFDLPEICARLGLTQVIIASGSRNAPLTNEFVKHPDIQTCSIVDERSAAFYGLGMAQALRQPVAVLCTSGSAVLNLAPAIAEAYYQHVPLVVFTADRPVEWIDQNDNQTLNQRNIYASFIKKSVSLPQEIHSRDDLWYAHRLISEAMQCAMAGDKGPVHINIPLREPLYKLDGTVSTEIKVIRQSANFGVYKNDEIARELTTIRKIMIVCGQGEVDNKITSVLNIISGKELVVLAENIGNIPGDGIFHNPEILFASINETEKKTFAPDLIISYGGQVISKRLKMFLRQISAEHWYISPSSAFIDTYQHLTRVITSGPSAFFEFMVNLDLKPDKEFYQNWHQLNKKAAGKRNTFLYNIGYSDLLVFHHIYKHIPKQTVVQLGNSTPVRYAEMVGNIASLEYYSNRGVSGIDGCVSTAAGFAMQTDKIVTLVVGDLSFVYDSNGLWNKALPDNLKIIVINNQGGGIFRLINDAEKVPFMEEYQETNHPVDLKKLTGSFNIQYDCCQSENDLTLKLENLYASTSATVLEIKTPREKNVVAYRNFFNYLRS